MLSTQPLVLALEVDVKSTQTVHSVFANQPDNSGANKPRYIVMARALDDPSEGQLETEMVQETTEYGTDETEEPMTEERLSSTESSLFTSTSAAFYSTESAPTVSITDQSLVARTGEAADAPTAEEVSL